MANTCFFCRGEARGGDALTELLNIKLPKRGEEEAGPVRVHDICRAWVPDSSLEEALFRAWKDGKRLKCGTCGKDRAMHGCMQKRCMKTFHIRCCPGKDMRSGSRLTFCAEHNNDTVIFEVYRRNLKLESEENKRRIRQLLGMAEQDDSAVGKKKKAGPSPARPKGAPRATKRTPPPATAAAASPSRPAAAFAAAFATAKRSPAAAGPSRPRKRAREAAPPPAPPAAAPPAFATAPAAIDSSDEEDGEAEGEEPEVDLNHLPELVPPPAAAAPVPPPAAAAPVPPPRSSALPSRRRAAAAPPLGASPPAAAAPPQPSSSSSDRHNAAGPSPAAAGPSAPRASRVHDPSFTPLPSYPGCRAFTARVQEQARSLLCVIAEEEARAAREAREAAKAEKKAAETAVKDKSLKVEGVQEFQREVGGDEELQRRGQETVKRMKAELEELSRASREAAGRAREADQVYEAARGAAEAGAWRPADVKEESQEEEEAERSAAELLEACRVLRAARLAIAAGCGLSLAPPPGGR